MSSSSALLTDDDRTLLLKVSSLLEEVIETLEVLEDRGVMKSIREAEEDVETGRVRSYMEFTQELKERGEL
ncbi:MAG: hypothetical protein ACOC6H_04735 [Thermoproteota archaeon]